MEVKFNGKQIVFATIALALTVVAIATSATLPYSDAPTKILMFGLIETLLILPVSFVIVVLSELK